MKNREEMGRKLDKALRRRDDRIREEMEWLKVAEEREGGVRNRVRVDLEKLLERREVGLRELVREEVRKALMERIGRVEGARDPEGRGGQVVDGEKDSGKDKVGKRGREPVRGREEERQAVRGDAQFPPQRAHVVVRGGPGKTYSEALRKARGLG